MGIADCVTQGGDYPEEYAFSDNTTIFVTIIGHTAADV